MGKDVGLPLSTTESVGIARDHACLVRDLYRQVSELVVTSNVEGDETMSVVGNVCFDVKDSEVRRRLHPS